MPGKKDRQTFTTPPITKGFGGYTYSFDPTTGEISILEDPLGRVPAGYVVPKGSIPYEAILHEMRGMDKPMEGVATEAAMDRAPAFRPETFEEMRQGAASRAMGTETTLAPEPLIAPPSAKKKPDEDEASPEE